MNQHQKIAAQIKKAGIPDFLNVYKRRTPEQIAASALRCKHMIVKFKEREIINPREVPKPIVTAVQPKQPKQETVVMKKEMPQNSFTLRDWAKSKKLDPRDVRAAARSVKAKIAALQVPDHKYVFLKKDETKLALLLSAAMGTAKKKPAKKVTKKIVKITKKAKRK